MGGGAAPFSCASCRYLAEPWPGPSQSILWFGSMDNDSKWHLIAFLILSSSRGLVQFNSSMNSEPPNYEITDNTRGNLGTSRVFWLPQQIVFGPAANPFNNFSPLNLLTRAERLSDCQSRISQAVQFREPGKTQWFILLKTPLPRWRERQTDRERSMSLSAPSILKETEVVAVPV